MLKIFVVFLSFALTVHGFVKTWAPTQSRQIYPKGQENECSRKTFVYQSAIGVEINLPKQFNKIVLPRFGVIIIDDNVELTNLSDGADAKQCNLRKDYTLIQFPIARWYNPQNWNLGEEESKAILDIDRIPCQCDTVILPKNQPIYIYLDQTVYVQDLEIHGGSIRKKFLNTEIGNSMFINVNGVAEIQVISCSDPETTGCGCHNRDHYETFSEILCWETYCEVPHCIDPIHPVGNCCPICGVVIEIENIESCVDDQQTLEMFLKQSALQKYEQHPFKDLIEFSVNLKPGLTKSVDTFQIVIVDKDKFNGYSYEYLRHLKENPFFGKKMIHRILKSGIPYHPNDSMALVIFGTLLLVLSMFGLIYFFTYNEKSQNWIPQKWQLMNRYNLFSSRGDGDTDSIATVAVGFNVDDEKTRIAEYGGAVGKSTSSFDNPLFKNTTNDSDKIATIGPNANILNESSGDGDGGGAGSVSSYSLGSLVEVDLELH